jgi:L-lactate dehydrogenase
MRVGIVGTGWVGTSVAISVLQEGIARELLLNDVREALAEGEALDLSHGAPFLPEAEVRAASVAEMRGCDAVVIAAGRNGRPGESRLDLLKDNAELTRSLARALRGHTGLVIMVSNPVDVLTQVLVQESGLPHERVIGTGTLLDTARLRSVLGRELRVSSRSIHAHVLGEHGDSQVATFSSAHVGGLPLRSYPGWSRDRERTLSEGVRRAAGEIIRRKGATNHAIGLATAHLLKWILRDERRIVTVSRIQDGALGLRDVALSLPAILGRDGAVEVIEPQLDDDERAALEQSAGVLRGALSSLTKGLA